MPSDQCANKTGHTILAVSSIISIASFCPRYARAREENQNKEAYTNARSQTIAKRNVVGFHYPFSPHPREDDVLDRDPGWKEDEDDHHPLATRATRTQRHREGAPAARDGLCKKNGRKKHCPMVQATNPAWCYCTRWPMHSPR